VNTLAEIIRHEIALNGVLSFARFMEFALYCPDFGYYEANKDNVGRYGDFYTSVSVGNLFGELLACQFGEWMESLHSSSSKAQPAPLSLVEAGAHDGKLASDILAWFQSHRPQLFDQLEYIIIEPSLRRQEWQKQTLKEFGMCVQWFSSFTDLKTKKTNLTGIIFANELLDAFPVRRFGWDAANKSWFEWGVGVAGEQFVWEKIRNAKLKIQNPGLNLPDGLLAVLPDGYIVETSPAAENWWRDAAELLSRGKLFTIDYGFTEDEIISPGRIAGTLRAYFKHHVADDLLANVGRQDLTAHVNFSSIQRAGESVGLRTDFFSTQPKFLTGILEKALKDKSFGEWTPSRTRQFQTLTHPEHLGRSFRVLAQSR
jgi:SAM-dependent MidA family methyltransferase